MLSVAEEYLRELNPDARLEVFGQDYNNESFAICSSDMMIKGQDAGEHQVRQQLHPGRTAAAAKFDYLLANPPFGVEWKPQADVIEKERRGEGIPRPLRRRAAAHQRRLVPVPPAHDLEDEARGLAPGDRLQRLAAVHRRCRVGRERDPPLDHRERLAGSHRRPADQMFYNTGISTYIWVLTNRKRKERRGKIQLINATDLFVEDAEEPRQQAERAVRTSKRTSPRSSSSTAT